MGVLIEIDDLSWKICERGLMWRKEGDNWERSGATVDTLRAMMHQVQRENRQREYDRTKSGLKALRLRSLG